MVGLYRLCGSAAVKKELRDAFERDSAAVTLSEQLYPDINVITGPREGEGVPAGPRARVPRHHAHLPLHGLLPTGILKDYLRELPTPLITPTLYHVVLEAMAKRHPRTPPGERDAVTLLDCLPDVEKVRCPAPKRGGPNLRQRIWWGVPLPPQATTADSPYLSTCVMS